MFRSLVSGTRRRYKDDGFNVDMTYISKNVIVMSFPGNGCVQTQYRNDHREVRRLLDMRHGDNYHVFNVSESQYDKSRFYGRVSNYNWPDHQAPPFHMLFFLVDEMKKWLENDPDHVVVIHCNSGKGRAGTATSCLLLFTGTYDRIEDCAKMFSSRRFTDKKGIT